MANEYKITQSSNWKYFHKILLTTLVLVAIVFTAYRFYLNINDKVLLSKIFLGILFGWFITFGLPLFLLFFNHKKYSKSVIFKRDNNEFYYSNIDDSISFNLNDIEKVELWLTPPAYDKRIDWQFFGKYHFTSIHTNKGKIINISCLVCDETKEFFPHELIKRKKKFFPFMKENNLSNVDNSSSGNHSGHRPN